MCIPRRQHHSERCFKGSLDQWCTSCRLAFNQVIAPLWLIINCRCILSWHSNRCKALRHDGHGCTIWKLTNCAMQFRNSTNYQKDQNISTNIVLYIVWTISFAFFGASLSESHIDRDNVPHCREIYVSMHVCMWHACM